MKRPSGTSSRLTSSNPSAPAYQSAAAAAPPRTTMCGEISMARNLRTASCTFLRGVEDVRMWREDGVLMMRGRTRGYVVEPRGEYVVGVIERGHMRARRDRRSYDFGPGDVCVW